MKKLIFFFLCFFLGLNSLILAQWHVETEIEDEQAVSFHAIVKDYLPPTQPVIQSPQQNDLLSQRPVFIWEASTDINGVAKYVIYLNEEVVFDNIPTSSSSNYSFDLNYNESSSLYTLTPKSLISDNEYTLKIEAVDASGNNIFSEMVFFTLDTMSPDFLINKIGEKTFNISAKTKNLPTEPLVFEENNLLLEALTEIGSVVSFSVKDESGKILEQKNNFTVNLNPYQVNLGLLPRDEVLNLNFTIVDKVGNTTYLNGLQILIESDKLEIPYSTQEASLLDKASKELSEVPLLPAREFVKNIGRRISDAIPEDVKRVAREVTLNTVKATTETAKKMAPVAVPVTTIATSGLSLLSFLGQLGQLSGNVGLQALQTLGLVKVKRKKGFVFDYSTRQPIPFALLTIQGQGANVSFKETLVTDVYGFYHGVKLPPGKYKITVEKEGYEFPIDKKHLDAISANEYYLGEGFLVSSNHEIQSFAIPMLPVGKKIKANFRQRVKTFFKNFNLGNKYFFRAMFIFSLIMTTYFPNKLNIFFMLFYFGMFIFKFLQFLKIPIITGVVTDDKGKPLSDVLVRINFNDNNDLASLVFTDKNGRFKFYGERDFYQINLIKDGYIYYQEDAVMSVFFTDTTKQKQSLAFVMMDRQRMQDTLFGEET